MISLIGAVSTIIVALIQIRMLSHTKTLKLEINGRMDQIVRQAEAIARAAGVKEGEKRLHDQ